MTQQLLDVVIPGLVVGCLYGLIGMAFAVVYNRLAWSISRWAK
jgi:hypothetical protein